MSLFPLKKLKYPEGFTIKYTLFPVELPSDVVDYILGLAWHNCCVRIPRFLRKKTECCHEYCKEDGVFRFWTNGTRWSICGYHLKWVPLDLHEGYAEGHRRCGHNKQKELRLRLFGY